MHKARVDMQPEASSRYLRLVRQELAQQCEVHEGNCQLWANIGKTRPSLLHPYQDHTLANDDADILQ